MLPTDIWPAWVVSVGVIVPLVVALAVCICGCRKTVPKNELLGLDGVVKITNPEENISSHHVNESNGTTLRSITPVTENTEVNRRPVTANRSLPDIPVDSRRINVESGEPLWEHEGNGDTSSELYATVEENKQSANPLMRSSAGDNVARKQEGARRHTERNSQPSDSFPPYATVKSEHPYDKLNKSEHPYAQVGASGQSGSSSNSRELGNQENARNISLGASASSNGEPVPPPRTRRALSQSSLSTEASGVAPADIPAATAITGRIHANQDLPYMTPPIPGFSGDSQDSKGYTSISVREPLAKIKAQTKAANQRTRTQELLDSHYATVSDDSDEMYAAIEDPGAEYTSGSETYAQIQSTSVEVAPAPALAVAVEETEVGGAPSPPQPPSVDSLRHVAQAHSRQASTSSATSSVINMGSPKPEKRQANSPLPPPPLGSPESRASAPVASLEEMYAKVMKKKHRSIAIPENSLESAMFPPLVTDCNLSTVDAKEELVLQSEPETNALHSVNVSTTAIPLLEETKKLYDSNKVIHPQPHGGSDAAVYSSPPARVESFRESEPGYESVGPNSLVLTYDPGYEVVNQVHRNPSDCDPNYEQLRPQRKNDAKQYESANQGGCDGKFNRRDTDHVRDRTRNTNSVYASVKQSSPTLLIDEPNYESMTSDCQDHYAVVSGASGGESDSAYEIVHQDDPNYESVNYFDVNNTEPPYERLHNEEARDSDSETVSGYEKVKLQNENSANTSGSELAPNELSQCNSESGYEEVGQTANNNSRLIPMPEKQTDVYSKIHKK